MFDTLATHVAKTMKHSSITSTQKENALSSTGNGYSIIRATSLALLACFSLSSCSKYQMTVNEAVVYTPPTVITDFETQDPRLKDCLDQMIKDGEHTDLAQVTQLICSHAGLNSLEGLQTFYNLKQVNLGNNQISDLTPIKFLSKLEVLLLNDNQLTQVPELLNLPKLKQVNLDNNAQLQCGDIQQLLRISDVDLTQPEQCL